MNGKQIFISEFEKSQTKEIFAKKYCEQYYYFSQRQIIAFSKILSLFPLDDTRALSLVASVIHDELGESNPNRVHSRLFKNFAENFTRSLPIGDERIVDGVKDYIRVLDDSFSKGPLAKALAAYQFLEKSAVETYAPLLNIFRRCFRNLTEEDLLFFSVHVEMEPNHEQSAAELIKHYNFSGEDKEIFDIHFDTMAKKWDKFWVDITGYCLS